MKYTVIPEEKGGEYPAIDRKIIKLPQQVTMRKTTNIRVEVDQKDPTKELYVLYLIFLGKDPSGKDDLKKEMDLCLTDERIPYNQVVDIRAVAKEGVLWALSYAIYNTIEKLEVSMPDPNLPQLDKDGNDVSTVGFRLVTKKEDYSVYIKKSELEKFFVFQ